MKKIVVVIGTRPDAIKLIPLYKLLKQEGFDAVLCSTDQHADLLTDILELFDVVPDISLNVMKAGQDLFYLTSVILEKMRVELLRIKPDLVLVQGDTTTAFAAALAAFYLRIPIGHVEAGLRTGNLNAPFPEEANRKFITQIADFHFAPTALNAANLLAEGVARDKVFCTGNTVVDALLSIKNQIEIGICSVDPNLKEKILYHKNQNKKIVLLTAHRRESHDGGLVRIFTAIKKFCQQHQDVVFFYPLHPNPNVTQALELSGLHNLSNVYLLKPLFYKDLVYVLSSIDWVVTDSGGIQEEAVCLGKRVLVLRDVTERTESLWEGMGKLVGTNEELIMKSMQELYDGSSSSRQPNEAAFSVYGDGQACSRIVSIIQKRMHVRELYGVEKKDILC
jgi:UDP-N-acetylglucosamine 2-epimerase (non-hydrolysing)